MVFIPLALLMLMLAYATIHKEKRLQLSCLIAGLYFCLYVPLTSIDWRYDAAFNVFMGLDVALVALLYVARAPAFALLLALLMVLYGAVALALPAHGGFYFWITSDEGAIDPISTGLFILFALSLTEPPRRWYWAYSSIFASSRRRSSFLEERTSSSSASSLSRFRTSA